jgi:uncharacterized protein YkwD
MLCKLIASGVVAAFLLDQGNQASDSKPKDAKKDVVTSPSDSTEANPSKDSTAEPKLEKSAKSKKNDLHEVEKQIVEKTNTERARYGLPPLVVDRNLIQSARTHAAWMTNNRTLQHTNRPVAENIAMGQRTTGEALNSWMGSSGHRANILNGGHKRIGVAAYRTPDGTIYWCQQFLP